MKQSNTVRAFISEECILRPSAYIPKDELYERYKEYCDREGLQLRGKTDLTQIVGEIPSVYTKSKRFDGRVRDTWFGIRTKSKGVGEPRERRETLDVLGPAESDYDLVSKSIDEKDEEEEGLE